MNAGKETNVADEEVVALLAVNHPCIVKLHKVYDMGLVMELCAGGDLKSKSSSNGGLPFDVPMVISIAVQLIGAVAHLHSKGIVHRDIKPVRDPLLNPPGSALLRWHAYPYAIPLPCLSCMRSLFKNAFRSEV